MSWEDDLEDLVDALESGDVLDTVSPQKIDIKIKVINDPIGIDFEKTNEPHRHVALDFMCQMIKDIKLVKREYRYLADQLQTGVDPKCIRDNVRKDVNQCFIDVFYAICKQYPRSVRWGEPSDLIGILEEKESGKKKRAMRKIKASFDDHERQLTLLSLIEFLPFKEKEQIRIMTEKVDSQGLYGFFRNKNKSKIIEEPQSTQPSNDPFALAVFTVIQKLFE